MIIIKYILIVCSLVLTVISCHRRPLETDYSKTAKIPIAINWEKSDINLQNVSVLFYDQNDYGNLAFEHRFEHNNNKIQSYVDLPVGKYTVVIFNELRDQIENIKVRGHKQLSTLEFYATNDNNINKRIRKGEADNYINNIGNLATYIVRDFNVTQDMVTYTRNQIKSKSLDTKSDHIKASIETLVGIEPIKRTRDMNITVQINGLNNARMPALVDLRNISGSYFIDTDRNADTPSTIQHKINNRTYEDGSTTDGTISTLNPVDPNKNTTIILFGTMGERGTTDDQPKNIPIELDILFMLVDTDKTIVNRTINITDKIDFYNVNELVVELNTYVSIDEPLPDVKPDGDLNSGFGSSVEDWENEYVYL